MSKTFRFNEDDIKYFGKKPKKYKKVSSSKIFYSKVNGKNNFGLSPLAKKRRTTYK